MRIGDGRFHVRIVRAIHRPERSFAADAALEFSRHLLDRALFERIGATAEQKGGAREEESGDEGLQARRILGKAISDK